MSREELISNVRVSRQDSGVHAHPEVSASPPSGFKLVSGGFKAEWSGAGNLCTASFPENEFSWKARSKDHSISDPSNLISYALSISENLLAEVKIDLSTSGQASHPSAISNLSHGYLLTGVGAEVHWNGSGSLLWNIEPNITRNGQSVTASSKDHTHPSPATVTAYSMGCRFFSPSLRQPQGRIEDDFGPDESMKPTNG